MKRSHRIPAVVAAATASILFVGVPISAADPAPSFSVTVNGTGAWNYPDDTPANPFIDSNGQFYFQESDSSYAASDPHEWSFYSGTNFDDATPDATLDNAVDPANRQDSNGNTIWRCNNSPTGLEATYAPAGSSYAERNFCDLNGVWVDPDTGYWYGAVHNEFTPQPFGDGLHYDAIDLAVSKDKGKTWKIQSHIITSPYATKRGDTGAFPQQTYDYGDGDPRLYVDTASGYFYIYYGSRIVDKGSGGKWQAFYEHVARAPMSDKMASGSWHKYYAGTWSQPGVGGKESNLVPVSAANPSGYTPPSAEYNPNTPGTTSQQVAASKTPPTSPLFVMDITYDAYLGEYIGEPQGVDQSGNAPQQYYATKSLATPRWKLIGDTGSYHTASWYRWFIDSANATSSNIVGKTLRDYCSVACSNGSDSEYANVTIDSSRPAAPVRSGQSYRIATAGGTNLGPAGNGVAASAHPSAWKFTSTGDGAYTIADPDGKLLGVDSSSPRGRAWGAKPALFKGSPTVGQQWFVIAIKSARNGAPTGTFKLVNRYSGLVLGLSAKAPVQTTPARSWTGGTGVLRDPSDQTLRLTPEH